MGNEQNRPALALGYFDGLHIAHKKVLDTVLAQSEQGLVPAVLLFDEAPAEVLRGVPVPRLITEAERDARLADMGLAAVNVSFRGLMSLSPERFVKEILFERLNCAFVCCGYNYRFGKEGAGDAKTLRAECAKYGITTHVCKQVRFSGRTVSSTAIRAALSAGDVVLAAGMLGRPFGFASPVVSGDRRGRTLGTPTINQVIPSALVMPLFGVYASVAEFGGKRYPAVTNIGSRPTFSGESARSETFILDFCGDLYGQTVRLELVRFLRPEKRFPDAGALKAQIALDAQAAAEVIKESPFFAK